MSDYSVSASYCYSMTILQITVPSEDNACKHDYCLGTMYRYVALSTISVTSTSGDRCSVLMVVYYEQKVSHTIVYFGCTSLILDVNDIEWTRI